MGRLPDTSNIEPAETLATVTVRLPTKHKLALADLARRKRMDTGAIVQTSDLIREAIAAYLLEHDTQTTEGEIEH